MNTVNNTISCLALGLVLIFNPACKKSKKTEHWISPDKDMELIFEDSLGVDYTDALLFVGCDSTKAFIIGANMQFSDIERVGRKIRKGSITCLQAKYELENMY